jgi:type IV pilus assembly protein PilV
VKVHDSNGFTLIEVLITLIILSISLLALAGLMARTTRTNASGAQVTEATTIAQDRMERLRATRWQDIPVGDTGDQVIGSTGLTYGRNSNVVLNGNLRTATVTVNWTDRGDHSVRLRSVMAQ